MKYMLMAGVLVGLMFMPAAAAHHDTEVNVEPDVLPGAGEQCAPVDTPGATVPSLDIFIPGFSISVDGEEVVGKDKEHAATTPGHDEPSHRVTVCVNP